MQFRGSLFLLCYIQVAWDWTDYTATAELDIKSFCLAPGPVYFYGQTFGQDLVRVHH